jgi:hypothetical protein
VDGRQAVEAGTTGDIGKADAKRHGCTSGLR